MLVSQSRRTVQLPLAWALKESHTLLSLPPWGDLTLWRERGPTVGVELVKRGGGKPQLGGQGEQGPGSVTPVPTAWRVLKSLRAARQGLPACSVPLPLLEEECGDSLKHSSQGWPCPFSPSHTVLSSTQLLTCHFQPLEEESRQSSQASELQRVLQATDKLHTRGQGTVSKWGAVQFGCLLLSRPGSYLVWERV